MNYSEFKENADKKKRKSFSITIIEFLNSNEQKCFLSLILLLLIIIIILLISLFTAKSKYNQELLKNSSLKSFLDQSKNKICSLYIEIGSVETRKTINKSSLTSLIQEFDEKKKIFENLKQIQISYLEKRNKIFPGSKPFSRIISFQELNQLEKLSGTLVASLCYRYSTDGPTPSKFHEKCDQYKGTLTIIKTKEGEIFGGYTSESWDGDTQKKDNKAFLFNINNKKQYPVKEDRIAMNAKQILFPTFGMDDIYLSSNIFTIRRDMTCYQGSKIDYEINGGKMLFDIIEIEVFHMIPTETWNN